MSSKATVIVESPAKAKTILKHLKSIDNKTKWEVHATFGHLTDLPKKDAIDFENNFMPKYEVTTDKKKHVKTLKASVAEATMVYLAADLDREGEAIAWQTQVVLKLKKGTYKRITFNEITESGIRNGLQNPRDIDYNLVDAQKGRRVIDRLYGYDTTSTLWKYFKNGSNVLSAGRVQSAVLKILVDKERDIAKYLPESNWEFKADLKMNELSFIATHVCDENQSESMITKTLNAMGSCFSLADVVIKERRSSPGKPFTTSTLQQEAYSTLSMSTQKSMKIAQDLYENGLITYMRTDSIMISHEAMDMIKTYVADDNYFQDRNATAKNKKNAQEAHECIRPTKLDAVHELLDSSDHRRLYLLILRRTVASQMKDAMFYDIHVKFVNDQLQDDDRIFSAIISELVFDGYLKVYDPKACEGMKTIVEVKAIAKGFKKSKALASKINANVNWKSPKLRYNEASIVKKLEKEGIGRPSTYASMVKKIIDRGYVEIKNVDGVEVDHMTLTKTFTNGVASPSIERKSSKKPVLVEQKKLLPTDTGVQVNSFMEEHFGALIDAAFTNDMESQLDKIAVGQKEYVQCVRDFYNNLCICIKQIKATPVQQDKGPRGADVDANGIACNIRTTRYGPVIQYNDPPKFINLQSYLDLSKKTLQHVNREDVLFLFSFPREIAANITISYGAYGFYLTNSKTQKKASVLPSEFPSLLNADYSKIMKRLEGKI